MQTFHHNLEKIAGLFMVDNGLSAIFVDGSSSNIYMVDHQTSSSNI